MFSPGGELIPVVAGIKVGASEFTELLGGVVELAVPETKSNCAPNAGTKIVELPNHRFVAVERLLAAPLWGKIDHLISQGNLRHSSECGGLRCMSGRLGSL